MSEPTQVFCKYCGGAMDKTEIGEHYNWSVCAKNLRSKVDSYKLAQEQDLEDHKTMISQFTEKLGEANRYSGELNRALQEQTEYAQKLNHQLEATIDNYEISMEKLRKEIIRLEVVIRELEYDGRH